MRYLWKLIFSLCLTSQVACQPLKTVNVNVVGDDGNPIEGAEVVVWFYGYQPEDSKSDEGLTNEEGNFHAQGRPLLGMLARVTKDGYYQTEKDRLPMTEEQSLTLILREKKNPIPLHAKNERLRFPVNDEWLGYDFEVGDFVPPQGEGKTIDVYFKVNTEMTAPRDGRGTFEMKFKEEEGIILVEEGYLRLSEMKMPHVAPDKGYTPHFYREEESFRNKNRLKGVGYFFRTRVVKENDEVVSANYGKILEDIRFGPRHANLLVKNPTKPDSYATVSFSFYFNPTSNDRNVEFDPSSNLIKGLKYGERVSQP
ncbi:carboxypeptidase-like regulatory domain-containing protein [Kiritimatiellota bacterium B12222]|nr:carboxypeptidase-like regulatory domain-containing protein [Kiritimatiellota bacterium B12222]